MDFSVKKYIDFIDHALDLDTESKRKTSWIIIRILNILMTIELAVFLASKFGYEINEDGFNIDGVIIGFKNYDIIIGVVFIAMAYFGGRLYAWFFPYIFSYIHHWAKWEGSTDYREKLNGYLQNHEEFEKWKKFYDYRSQRGVRFTIPSKLILLFCSNLFLTYGLIVRIHLPQLFHESFADVILLFLIGLSLVFPIFHQDILWAKEVNGYFLNREEFKIKKTSSIKKKFLEVVRWISLFLHVIMLGVLSVFIIKP